MGRATAFALAREGANIVGVHFDQSARKAEIAETVGALRDCGVRAEFFNVNAAGPRGRAEAMEGMRALGVDRVRVLLHSLAFGALLPFIATESATQPAGEAATATIDASQMAMTVDVMAHSLVYWTQDLHRAGMLSSDSRIFALSSIGAAHVIPSYGAVSAAKSTLEAHVRQLAVELAPLGVAVNALRAGVTDTPALHIIPGHDRLLTEAKARNPSGRITTVEDVADSVVLLSQAPTSWMTGNVIAIDGAEELIV
jgi:NAD(P)-dependent dehydrogenase (short-subunit alcohol dehydrogenase family)